MVWGIKVELVKALNNGNNKEACDIILNNEMDMQAWDMFISGMDLMKSSDYASLYDKLLSVKEGYIKQAEIRESFRFLALLSILED